MWTERQAVGTVIGAVGVGMVVGKWLYIWGQGELVFVISTAVLLIGLFITFAPSKKKEK